MRTRSVIAFLVVLTFGHVALWGDGSQLRFDPSRPDVGPFPTDFLTVTDPLQRTGRRMNLPLPDCNGEPSTCEELALINQLDGFNVFPRIRVRFNVPVEVETLQEAIHFVALENLTQDETGRHKIREVITADRIIYDPETLSAFAKPDEVLDQHRRYALVITNALHDESGRSLEADGAFRECVSGLPSTGYCAELGPVVQELSVLFPGREIIGATVFSTQSATAWLENAREAIQDAPLGVERVGNPSVYDISDVEHFILRGQTFVNPAEFRDFFGPFRPQGGIRIAFLSFRAPNFLNESSMIPPAPTGVPLELPSRTDEIQFHAFLPATPPPAEGYPVVLVSHGFGENRFTIPTALAPAFAAAGMATISISIPGHGFGPESSLIMERRDGTWIQVPAPGRSVDEDGDGEIFSFEGGLLEGIPNTKDTARQAVVEYMQLVREIRNGIDVDGDGRIDLNGDRIYNVSHSFGVTYGTILNAVEPHVRAGVLMGGAGSIVDAAAVALPFRALTAIAFLEGRAPNLLNFGAINFEQNYVFPNLPVVVNNVAGAIELQEFFERSEWFQNSGDALGYAAHLKTSPLPGRSPKRMLIQMYKRDITMPNPMTSQLIRTADAREQTRMFRQDLALSIVPWLPVDPHRFAFIEGPYIPAMEVVSDALQLQISGFLASDGEEVPDVNPTLRNFFGQDLMEVPEVLPESLYY